METLNIKSTTGRNLMALYLPRGESITSPKYTADRDAMVLFFDVDSRANKPNVEDWKEYGQFISAYYFNTVADVYDNGRGIDLYGGEDDWKIGRSVMRDVGEWLIATDVGHSKTKEVQL